MPIARSTLFSLLWSVAFLWGSGAAACGQTPRPGTPAGPTEVKLPGGTPFRPPDAFPRPIPPYQPGFLKKFELQSFGIGAGPLAPGYELNTNLLSAGPWTAQGLECPRCLIRSTSERGRYTLPPFGAEITRKLAGDRVELFGGYGAVNGWRADNTTIETGKLSFRRDSSFNDAWLSQSWMGLRMPVDSGKRVWLGGMGRYLMNFGPYGRRHWNTFGANATILLGH